VWQTGALRNTYLYAESVAVSALIAEFVAGVFRCREEVDTVLSTSCDVGWQCLRIRLENDWKFEVLALMIQSVRCG
jgi:hypothetical protein